MRPCSPWHTVTAYAPPNWWTCDGIRSIRLGNAAVRRVKQGTASTHPIRGDELRALRRLKREQEPKSPFVFTQSAAAIHDGRLRPHDGARRVRGQTCL